VRVIVRLPGVRLALCAVAATLLTAAAPARANGVISEMPAGGLVFKKTDTISIASEELYLSMNEVRVSYLYQSKAPAAQNVTISFPMPPVEVDSGPLSEFLFSAEEKGDLRNYMKFAVTVDGKPVSARLRETALLDGKDVTARLKSAGVPPIFLDKDQETMKRMAQGARDALIKEGLFEKPDAPDPSSYAPRWKYQVLYEWEQSFPPGPTKVDIRYRPITGDGQDFGDFYFTPEATKLNCVDEAFRNALKRRSAANKLGDRLTLGYVVKTARYWSGPIGRFRLVVDKGKAENLVAFCPLSARKISETQFEWVTTNFTPERDIDVVFFAVQGSEQ
jgi:hypothetical protein